MAYVGFKKLESSISGARDPGAVAASIGRRKYGKAPFQRAAAAGKSMRGMRPAMPARSRALRRRAGGGGMVPGGMPGGMGM